MTARFLWSDICGGFSYQWEFVCLMCSGLDMFVFVTLHTQFAVCVDCGSDKVEKRTSESAFQERCVKSHASDSWPTLEKKLKTEDTFQIL